MMHGKKMRFEDVRSASSILAMLVSTFAASSAFAQSNEPAQSSNDSADIVVTGVRGKPRSVLDSPTPVDVLSGKELASSGHASLYQDLQMTVPSFNQPMKAGSGTSAAIMTGALRGLNPDHTLVLVNGQRWHHTSLINVGQGLYNGSVPVDLSMIPATAIERIEVMREGAAAQYGSDAIAGVINIILKDTPGGSVSAQYGQNLDRSDGELAILRGDYGFRPSESSSLNLFFSIAKQNQSNRAIPVGSNIQIYPRLPDGSPDPREATVDRMITKSFGVYPYKSFQVGYNFQAELGGETELYSFGMIGRRLTDLLYPPYLPSQSGALPEIVGGRIIYPLFKIRETDGQVALGVRGTHNDWDWNFSTTAGSNYAGQDLRDSLNASLGPVSPTSFHLGALLSREWVNSFDVTRQLDMGNGGKLQVSFGLQHRFENFKIKEGDPASYVQGTYVRPAGQPFAGTLMSGGAVYAPGFRPSDAGSWNRNVLSAYAELGYEPNDRLFIGVAGRMEHFDDSSGTSVVGKIDGRYKLTNWLTMRGSFGNGFHAPSLAQQHYSTARVTAITDASGTRVFTSQTLPVNSPAAIALGATPLRPEKSIDMSAGFTMYPSSNFNITVDGYITKLKSRIALGSLLQGTAVDTILQANGLPSNLGGQYFTNAVDTRTIGADIIATYRKDLSDLGNLRLTAAVNLNKTKITHIDPNPAELTSLGSAYVLVNHTSRGYLTNATPKSKIALGQNWAIGKFEFNLQEIRYGKFIIPGANVNLDRTSPAKWITNVQVKYHLSKNVSISAGIDNMFNVYPPANGNIILQLGFEQYPRFTPYGFTGGSYYGKIQVEF